MLSSDVILGIGNEEFFRKDKQISSGILMQDYNYAPCGAPVIVSVTKNETLGCLTLFPAKANTGCGFVWTPTHIVAFIDRKPLHENHRVRNIEKFDYSRFDTVIRSVKAHGGVSFVSKEKSSVLSILDSIKSIVGEYKYSSLFQFSLFNGRFLSGEDDNLLNVLSFFDLSHCVPLFNLKKVDGLGISFTQILRKHSELVGCQISTLRLDIVVSNYEDNLFIIDGATIDHRYPIKSSLYKEIKKYTKKDIPVKKDKLKTTLSKQDKPDHFIRGNFINNTPPMGDIQVELPQMESIGEEAEPAEVEEVEEVAVHGSSNTTYITASTDTLIIGGSTSN